MNLNKILDEWTIDSAMDIEKLDVESVKISQLHQKYLRWLIQSRRFRNKLNIEEKQLTAVLWQYYRGELNNADDLKEINKEPMGLEILKQNIPTYIDSDKEMKHLKLQKLEVDELVAALEEIMKALNNRNWNIRNAIEFQKYLQGNI